MNSPVRDEAASSTADAADELVVRRDTSKVLRTALTTLLIASLLLFWLPALIVLIRREPGYFTGGILWTALIATAVLVGLGMAAAAWWRRSVSRRPLMTLSPQGVEIPGHQGQAGLTAQWDELALVRLLGRRDDEMAFYPKPSEIEEPETDAPQLDLSEPEHLRPLDFDNDPPPQMRAPERGAFDQITPLPPQDPTDEPASPGPERQPGSLYGTPHVVDISRPHPPVRELVRAVRRYSNGRVPLA